jgi:hypothetical protein
VIILAPLMYLNALAKTNKLVMLTMDSFAIILQIAIIGAILIEIKNRHASPRMVKIVLI